MINSLTLKAPAKINLTLDVFSKRADGYHSLASIMQTISLYDTLTFTRTEQTGVTFTLDAPNSPDVPTDPTNLVVRAANAVLSTAELADDPATGLHIHLVKHIPSQAGLGGGSSDAATALIGTNRLLPADKTLSDTQLHTLATTLGSDVPFFLKGGAAVARGRGEKLTALPDLPTLWLVVVKPEESVSTAWAYNALDAHADRASHRATKRLEEAIQAEDWERLLAFQSNDFELPVFAHHPKLAWLHDELRMAGAMTAHLCGSGSAIYGVAKDERDAERIASLLVRTGKYPQVAVAHTLGRDDESELEAAKATVAHD